MKGINFIGLITLILFGTACQNKVVKFIPFDDDRIEYMGRLGMNEQGFAEIYWPGYIEKAVVGMEDGNIYTLFVAFKQTPGHPRIGEQEEMANKLIDFIEVNIDW